MKDMGAYGVALLGVLVLGGTDRAAAAPTSANVIETRPVLTGPLDLNRLQGEVVCIYNFSSW